jgi:cyclopropane fatty-acyl-phospholipid synthase-like methyltransferase
LENRKFDRIVSVGMVEHVGKEHLHEDFSAVNEMLENHGISMLHCITGRNEDQVNSWIDKYIFPGGYIPSIRELRKWVTSELPIFGVSKPTSHKNQNQNLIPSPYAKWNFAKNRIILPCN